MCVSRGIGGSLAYICNISMYMAIGRVQDPTRTHRASRLFQARIGMPQRPDSYRCRLKDMHLNRGVGIPGYKIAIVSHAICQL